MNFLKLILEFLNARLYSIKNRKKILIIPLEISVRELSGAITLATQAAQAGWFVVIGGKSAIFPMIPTLPRAYISLKSIVPGEVHLQRSFRHFGHRNICHDIEGLTPSNGLSGINLRFSAESIEECSHIFFWGQKQFEATKNVFPKIEDKASVSGSPVADFWHYHHQSLPKAPEDKKNIFFATSFPIVNHPMGENYFLRSLHEAAPQALNEFKSEFSADIYIQKQGFTVYKDLLIKLAETYPDRTIYLRPHPTENQAVWQDIHNRFPNIVFAREGEISQWFGKVGYFIHYNSTTAIQASLYGLRVSSLLPSDRTYVDARFSEPVRLVTNEFASANEIITDIANSGSSKGKAAMLSRLTKYLDNAHPDRTGFGSRAIVAHLDKLHETFQETSEGKTKNPHSLWSSFVTLSIKPIVMSVISMLSFYSPVKIGRMNDLSNRHIYGRLKQPRLNKNSVREIIKVIVGRSGEAKFKYKVLGNKIMVIKPD
jgi:surface carbohydrate biosynthesis protein